MAFSSGSSCHTSHDPGWSSQGRNQLSYFDKAGQRRARLGRRTARSIAGGAELEPSPARTARVSRYQRSSSVSASRDVSRLAISSSPQPLQTIGLDASTASIGNGNGCPQDGHGI